MYNTLAIQQRLLELGFNPGKLDGLSGDNTRAAIRMFQAARALHVDGIAGRATLAALFPQAAGVTPVQPPAPSAVPTPSTGAMTTSPAGRAAISQREGVRLTAYQDSIGVWTVGVGHTAAAGPPAPHAGMTISAAECDAILSRDLAKFEAGVLKAVKGDLRQNEFDALVSFAFNVGLGAFGRSSVLRQLNAGNKAAAANALLAWNKAGGNVLDGLTTRRQSERAQFLKA